MRQFWIFTQKEFYHILRDRWTMIILLVLPVVMLILFGYAITTEIRNSHFVVFDPSRDVATQGIVNKLETSEYFVFDGYVNSPQEAEQIFQQGDIGMFIIFGENFYNSMLHTGDAQVRIVTDGSDPNTANTLTLYAQNLMLSYQQDIFKSAAVPYQIEPEIRLLYNPTMKGLYNTVPGVMGMLIMLVCAMMTSVSIVREKEKGNMEILLVSPMKPISIILAKVVPFFMISLLNFATIIFIATVIMGVPVNGSWLLLIAVSLLFIFVSLAIGILISTLVSRQMVALLASAMGLLLPAVLLSGLIFPVSSMPFALQMVAQILPVKWYIEATRAIMIMGVGFSAIATQVVVLSTMAILLLVLSLRNFKIRLD
ncbi:MAG: multidrug ABC transporter permease [Bacteroidetes bacterium GWF2_43_63]|nr:MAG: multidrug ABC transporter permease [Bacteroidetes bacterium GWE2_42_42]OFY54953.1 MAG: multidrug ABC transporter permease [Bacteroidetes bacterium GWF2_43_63]HCB63223.1 multidrug ABC transporter permease [Bacteroidales bacterium]HCY22172.1 multidrug ABC transporter permease [Bacteroidales bacterium]